MKRHTLQAGRCKTWSAAIVGGVLLFSTGKPQMAALPWAAGVVVLLAFADACQVVMSRACTDAYHAFMRKLPLNGGNAMKAEECFVLPAPEPSWRQTGQVLGALCSLSVLPFYGAMLALVIAFHVQMSPPNHSAKSSGWSAGGGCGTSGGCGSGGCGASSGKGCGCGSGSSVAEKSAQPKAKPATQIKVSPPTRPTGIQSGSPSSFSPPRPVQTQPTIRIPTAPPNTGQPPNGTRAQTPLQTLTPLVPSSPLPAEAPGSPAPAVPAGK